MVNYLSGSPALLEIDKKFLLKLLRLADAMEV